jgi:membrane protease YdiL (CAAX protease family)
MVGAVPLLLDHTATAAAGLVVLAAVTVTTVRSHWSSAFDAVIVADVLYVAVLVDVVDRWPIPAALALVVAWISARCWHRVDQWRTWLRPGTFATQTRWLLTATVIAAPLALVAWWERSGRQLPSDYADAVSGRPSWQVLIAGIGFALVNAAVEEGVFRGVFQTALHALLRPVSAILIQAVSFGLLHLHGVPDGLLGVTMAGVWGLVLGVMRWRSGGIASPYIAHVAADLAILSAVLLAPS